jgi:hypothetical protein
VEDRVEFLNTMFTFTLFGDTKIIISKAVRWISIVNSTMTDDARYKRISYVVVVRSVSEEFE